MSYEDETNGSSVCPLPPFLQALCVVRAKGQRALTGTTQRNAYTVVVFSNHDKTVAAIVSAFLLGNLTLARPAETSTCRLALSKISMKTWHCCFWTVQKALEEASTTNYLVGSLALTLVNFATLSDGLVSFIGFGFINSILFWLKV